MSGVQTVRVGADEGEQRLDLHAFYPSIDHRQSQATESGPVDNA